MNLLRRGGLAAVCILCAVAVDAQQKELLRTDLISPSPTAAAIARYGDVPVTYYTGLPGISIPVYTVTGTELSLPISLTYNYSGFQPNQTASWVGLGWTLQAGGVITRTIGDQVDGKFTDQNNKYKAFRDISELQDQVFLKDSYECRVDNKPDVFNFNFGSYSGKFIRYEGETYIMPYQKLKITGGGTNGFTITTEDGTRYEFAADELTSQKGSPTGFNIGNYTSAWYLTKITNASQTESITLRYTSDGVLNQYGMKSQSYTVCEPGGVVPAGGGADLSSIVSALTGSYPTQVEQLRLMSITSDKVVVNFSGTAREDVDMVTGTAHALTQIMVSGRDGTVRSMSLAHEYFGEGEFSRKYLRLKSFTDKGSQSERALVHTFEYFNEDEAWGAGWNSRIDHFGYLNAQGSTNTLLPANLYPAGNGNREPNLTFARAYALRKITYPAGGSAEFIYELNTYRNPEGDTYVTTPDAAVITLTRPQFTPPEVTLQSAQDFHISHNQSVPLWFYRDPLTEPIDSNKYVPDGNTPEVRLYKVLYDAYGNEDHTPLVGIYQMVFNGENGGKHLPSIPLDTGMYRLVVFCDPTETEVHASLSYLRKDFNSPIEGLPGSGIRVSRIKTFTDTGDFLERKLSYTDTNGFSTGSMPSTTYMTSWLQKVYLKPEDNDELGRLTFITYTSTVAQGTGLNDNPYYSQVTETLLGDGAELTTTRDFIRFDGFPDVELIGQTQYQKKGGLSIPVQTLKREFSPSETLQQFTGVTANLHIQRITVGTTFGTPVGEYDYGMTDYTSVWKHVRKERTVSYEHGDSLVQEVRNFYNPVTRNLAGVRSTTSDGRTTYTRYKYPEDYSILGPLVDRHMLSQVIEEQVWLKNSPTDSVMISGKINEYSNTSGKLVAVYLAETASGIEAPLSHETKTGGSYYNQLISDNAYKKRASFNYDNNGRLVSQALTDNVPVSYAWAYPVKSTSGTPVTSLTQPVAEIRNASPGSYFHTSFEDESGAVNEAITGTLGHSGQFTIPGSYTGVFRLTYWRKPSGSPWQLVEQVVTNPSGLVLGASGTILDEVRLYPLTAEMKTLTYYNDWQVHTVTDANNKISYYEYDSFGRLKLIRDHQGNILKHYTYHLKNEIDSTLPSAQ